MLWCDRHVSHHRSAELETHGEEQDKKSVETLTEEAPMIKLTDTIIALLKISNLTTRILEGEQPSRELSVGTSREKGED